MQDETVHSCWHEHQEIPYPAVGRLSSLLHHGMHSGCLNRIGGKLSPLVRESKPQAPRGAAGTSSVSCREHVGQTKQDYSCAGVPDKCVIVFSALQIDELFRGKYLLIPLFPSGLTTTAVAPSISALHSLIRWRHMLVLKKQREGSFMKEV